MTTTSNTPTDSATQVRKNLEAIMSMGYHQYRVYEDWVGLMFYAFQRNNERYLEIMGRYRNDRKVGEREADYFAKALSNLMMYMRSSNQELLGTLFMEYASSHYKGQFFTPHHLCELMAQSTYVAPPPEKEFFTINDPACGAGAMLLALTKVQTVADQNKTLFIAQDIDLNCVRMCALNMMFFNLESVVIWGDSLMVEAREAWKTKRSLAFGGTLSPYPQEQALTIIEGALCAEKEKAGKTDDRPLPVQAMSAQQLSFF